MCKGEYGAYLTHAMHVVHGGHYFVSLTLVVVQTTKGLVPGSLNAVWSTPSSSTIFFFISVTPSQLQFSFGGSGLV